MKQQVVELKGTLSQEDRKALEDAYYFLNKQPAATLATINPNHTPHLTAVYYHVGEDLTISFITKAETRKSHNLKSKKKAALLAFSSEEQISVQVSGSAQEIDDAHEGQKVFTESIQTAIRTSEGGQLPLSKLLAGRYILYKLIPSKIEISSYNKVEPV